MPFYISLRATTRRYASAVILTSLTGNVAIADQKSAPPALSAAEIERLRRLLAEQRKAEAPTPAEIARLRQALLAKK